MKHFLLSLCFLFPVLLLAQPTQTIKGNVSDADTQQPLIGATVFIKTGEEINYSAVSDVDGNFVINNVPVGRHNMFSSYIGYEEWNLPNLEVTSAKEVVLNIMLTESVISAGEVVVIARKDNRSNNTYTTLSSRSFTVEETQRYAGSIQDAGRMAMSFAGVQMSAQDNENTLVVRGNSPVGVVWQLEGIPIQNPNHFADKAGSGGGISGLSINVLGNSDFSSGAFPAEYGNGIAGIMDMQFRKGNKDKREYRFQAGVIGLDLSTEGPFKKGKSSYLVNYRYSTLGLLSTVGINVVSPNVSNIFQDLSFNLHFKTGKKSYTSVFGAGGLSNEVKVAVQDTSVWKTFSDVRQYDFQTNFGVFGVSQTWLLNDKSFVKTTWAVTASSVISLEDSINTDFTNTIRKDEDLRDLRGVFSAFYSRKFNSQWNIKTGVLFTAINYAIKEKRYNKVLGGLLPAINGTINTVQVEPYAQLRFRPDENWTLNFGLHGLYFGFNNKFAIEPRAAIKYQISNKQNISLAYGLHSQSIPLGNYIALVYDINGLPVGTPNTDLGLIRAQHLVLAYSIKLPSNIRLGLEPYYQLLFNIPVSTNPNSNYWLLNENNEFTREALVSTGIGRNYGVDVTFEKFFSNRFFFLLSGSFFRSFYAKAVGEPFFSTRYDTGFATSTMVGKEWQITKSNSLEVSGRFLFSGGFRYTPIDKQLSALAGRAIDDQSRPFTEKNVPYLRLDARIAYRRNSPKLTWKLSLDVQNATNYKNIRRPVFDTRQNEIIFDLQSGLIPVLSYTIDF